MSFFSALEPLLKISPLNLMINRASDGKITLIAIPTGVTQDSAVLKNAMKFTGTAIELDAELIDRIQSIGNARLELSAMITKELELIEQEKAAKARSIAKKTTTSSDKPTASTKTPKPTPAIQDDGTDGNLEDGNHSEDELASASSNAVDSAGPSDSTTGTLF